MKNILIIIALLLSISTLAQLPETDYSRVKINLQNYQDITELRELGIATDHGIHNKGRHFITDLSGFEIQQLSGHGFDFEILIEDVETWYADPNRQEITIRDSEDCQPFEVDLDYAVPENFENGSMGGYFTWIEMLMILDEMKTLYPDLISTKQPIGEELTYEGRPIHWVRISDNAESDENEPEVLYTALHHSREPGSLTQLIFYMWYLLENYETDEQIQFLINNTEMYFIPCVNPDGYVYNQLNNPEGGGLWRKNRVENGDGSHGVDINRNYGYQWGYDNDGSSTNPLSETYRGPVAFSEPETRAVRDFCSVHQFQIALNYHTHGDLLVYPWSYYDAYTPDHETFFQMARAMTLENQYRTGITSETVGYAVNGDSDDWMYGEQNTKPAIFAFTPEVGASGGFWPSEDQIIPNCQKTMLMNLNAAALTQSFGTLKDLNSKIIRNPEANFYYTLQRIGLQDGPLEVKLLPVSENVTVISSTQSHELDLNEMAEGLFQIALDPEIQNGDTIQLFFGLDNGAYELADTLTKIYIGNPPFVSDDCSELEGWYPQSGNWAITASEYYSAPSCITDSPVGVYPNNADYHIEFQESIPIEEPFEKVFLNFRAKWAIEPEYDYAQVSLSVNDGQFVPLCGAFSKIGTNYQDEGNPVYDGFQPDWIEETIDITEYAGSGDDIKIRFSMVSDGYLQEDGFYFDDVNTFLVDNSAESTQSPNVAFLWNLYPSPASEKMTLEIRPHTSIPKVMKISFFDALGKKIISEKNVLSGPSALHYNTSLWQPGFYICKIDDQNGETYIKKFIIAH